jgi:hypothetical protein
MRTTLLMGVAASALVCALIATGCSQSPAAPSSRTTAAAPIATGDASGPELTIDMASTSPEHLEARGWDCRTPPAFPNLVTCSNPHQLNPLGLPGPPPPEDRPPSISLLVFDNGVFAGTTVLIRSDLYQGQRCRTTGGPYRELARIGYFECPHRPAAN